MRSRVLVCWPWRMASSSGWLIHLRVRHSMQLRYNWVHAHAKIIMYLSQPAVESNSGGCLRIGM